MITIEIILKLHSLQSTLISMFSFIWFFQGFCNKQGEEVFIWLDQERRNLGGECSYANMKWRVRQNRRWIWEHQIMQCVYISVAELYKRCYLFRTVSLFWFTNFISKSKPLIVYRLLPRQIIYQQWDKWDTKPHCDQCSAQTTHTLVSHTDLYEWNKLLSTLWLPVSLWSRSLSLQCSVFFLTVHSITHWVGSEKSWDTFV